METQDVLKKADSVATIAQQVANDIAQVTTAFTESKPWYQSKTIWGGVIAVGAAVGGAFGLHIDASTQAGIADACVVLGGGVGGLLAIFGRLTAQHKVGG
nr:hypothetical protein [uncultured Tolumonas sp.]